MTTFINIHYPLALTSEEVEADIIGFMDEKGFASEGSGTNFVRRDLGFMVSREVSEDEISALQTELSGCFPALSPLKVSSQWVEDEPVLH